MLKEIKRMLEREKNPHSGCPYRDCCKKDEEKCCYLVKGKCYLDHTDLKRLI